MSASNSTFRNLFLQNFKVIGGSNVNNLGSLLGECTSSCDITNVHVCSSQIQGKCGIGGIAGNLMSSNISLCTVQDTLVSYTGSSNYYGGIFGYGTLVMMTECFNLGYSNSSTQVIVSGHCYVGGLSL